MYRVTKPLNHNAVLAFNADEAREYLVVGRGVGFGRKPGERVASFGDRDDLRLYRLSRAGADGRGPTRELLEHIDPRVFDAAEGIYEDAREAFGTVDPAMLLPLADHLAFAVARARDGRAVSNPLTDDIRALFPREFDIARRRVEALEAELGVTLGEDEVGLAALHVHSALDAVHVSQAMQIAQITRACVDAVERVTGSTIDVSSFDYNRLMTHVKYMAARILRGECLTIDVNDAIRTGAPESYRVAETVCAEVERSFGKSVSELEVGYLAMHIARVVGEAGA